MGSGEAMDESAQASRRPPSPILVKMWSWGPFAAGVAGGARTVKTTARLGGMVGRLR